jgi:hypothetical protein
LQIGVVWSFNKEVKFHEHSIHRFCVCKVWHSTDQRAQSAEADWSGKSGSPQQSSRDCKGEDRPSHLGQTEGGSKPRERGKLMPEEKVHVTLHPIKSPPFDSTKGYLGEGPSEDGKYLL